MSPLARIALLALVPACGGGVGTYYTAQRGRPVGNPPAPRCDELEGEAYSRCVAAPSLHLRANSTWGVAIGLKAGGTLPTGWTAEGYFDLVASVADRWAIGVSTSRVAYDQGDREYAGWAATPFLQYLVTWRLIATIGAGGVTGTLEDAGTPETSATAARGIARIDGIVLFDGLEAVLGLEAQYARTGDDFQAGALTGRVVLSWW